MPGVGVSASTKTVTIPHSGENVDLQLNYSSWGPRGGWEEYYEVGPDRNIRYSYANGPGGNSHDLFYSDSEIEYEYSYSGDEIYQYYRCSRGNCDLLIDNIPFGKSFKGNSCPYAIELVLCYANGTYRKVSIRESEGEALFQSKSINSDDFAAAQQEYNQENGARISITLSQADLVELEHWRWVCKYPLKVSTGGPSFDPFQHAESDASNFLVVSRMNANFTEERGTGCPNR